MESLLITLKSVLAIRALLYFVREQFNLFELIYFA